MKNLESKIQEVIKNKLSPVLNSHGGGVELVEVDEKKAIAKVSFSGACIGCPMGQMTFENMVKEILLSEIENLKNVILI